MCGPHGGLRGSGDLARGSAVAESVADSRRFVFHLKDVRGTFIIAVTMCRDDGSTVADCNVTTEMIFKSSIIGGELCHYAHELASPGELISKM